MNTWLGSPNAVKAQMEFIECCGDVISELKMVRTTHQECMMTVELMFGSTFETLEVLEPTVEEGFNTAKKKLYELYVHHYGEAKAQMMFERNAQHIRTMRELPLPGIPRHIGVDSKGQKIYIGDIIETRGSGEVVIDQPMFTGQVLGLAANIANMLVIHRTDNTTGGYTVMGSGETGWGVSGYLVTKTEGFDPATLIPDVTTVTPKATKQEELQALIASVTTKSKFNKKTT